MEKWTTQYYVLINNHTRGDEKIFTAQEEAEQHLEELRKLCPGIDAKLVAESA